ncbi:cAMP-binding domain of CRP or a regulatory subunit of cAMP-dependent protein kinases [Algoriphagus locisalis]|uniref:cAMP-binding domain of CRP or a regulatory subunit of cAMP-dependent protein kinases n=1 Tax=Algoriphagus locisalis TaxID=305507 RepID=A0A1I6YFM5_9BACT|nr:Crp/Fnr family transcriptional regulator [Algoriphagus locisalis]SFT49180.1 cAMP-binding domain of CRP or a regulatory subunit of cAMP-dependent protein kinases [Algoriphagus locisalis]
MSIPVRPINESYLDFDFFQFISTSQASKSLGMMREITVKKNDYLYNPSTEHLYMYEILEGAVKLGSYTEDGEEFTFDVLFKKDFFGDLKYLNNQFFEFSKALIDTQVRIYNRDFFKKMVVQTPEVSEWFISYLVKRWCSTEKKLKKLHEKKAKEKLIFLSTYFDLTIQDAYGKSFVLNDLLTQKDIGDLIGVTRQTVANSSKVKVK